MPLLIALFLAGLVVGVAVNWLADQLPRLGSDEDTEDVDENTTAGRQLHLTRLQKPVCVHCGAPRPVAAYSGLVAWVLGKRRCETCGHPLSIRYPIVEILLAVIFTYLGSAFGFTGQMVAFMVYMTLFVLIAVIDIETRYILNVLVLPAFVFGLIELALSGRVRLRDALAGYAVGQMVVLVLYLGGVLYLWNLNRGRENKITEIAFGFGDVTLATFCGLIVGFPNVVVMLVLMVLIGGVIAFIYGLYYIIVARRYGGYVPIAYGPAILIAATIMLLWPSQVFGLIFHTS